VAQRGGWPKAGVVDLLIIKKRKRRKGRRRKRKGEKEKERERYKVPKSKLS